MQIEDIRRMAHAIVQNRHIESDFIEFKKSAIFKNKILKTACAFANNYMNREIGLLFIGIEEVDDKETGEKAIPKRPIIGVAESMIEGIENSLKQLLANIHPKISYHLITDMIDYRHYIIIAVEPGNAGPYQTSDKAEKDKDILLKAGRYIRVRRDSRLPNSKEEFILLKKFANYNFSSNLNETATIDDLSYEYMKEYVIATNAKSDVRKLSKLDMAKSMGLISESEYGGYRAKNFAVLMFAEKPDKFIPYAHVEIIREAIGTDKMEAKVFDGPIWIQAKQVSKYFRDNIMASYTVRESDVIEHRIVYNWPLTVFEELATNCILHKEYESQNYIGIYIYDDRITFVNHNRPVPPVTIEAMNNQRCFDDRRYLNPELKEMFFALDLIESYGSGIRRAKDALADNQSPELQFWPDNDMDNYTMAVVKINEEFARIREEEGKSKTIDKHVKKPIQDNKNANLVIFLYCKTPHKMNEIQIQCDYKDKKYFRKTIIHPLLEKNLLGRTIPDKPRSPKQQYCITEKFMDIISMCSKYNVITNEAAGKLMQIKSDSIRLSMDVFYSLSDMEIITNYVDNVCDLFDSLSAKWTDIFKDNTLKSMYECRYLLDSYLNKLKSCKEEELNIIVNEFWNKTETLLLDFSKAEMDILYNYLGISSDNLEKLLISP